MNRREQSFVEYLPYILGYICFVAIPVCGITAVIFIGKRLTGCIYNHITRNAVLVDVIDLALLIAIFFICLYAVIFVLNMLRKENG
jgi:Na+-transporting NADH:ubiquinone oxidoreductase subunit NqrE